MAPPPPTAPPPAPPPPCLFDAPGICIEQWHIIGASTAFFFFVLVCCVVLIVCRCWQPCGPIGTGEKTSRTSEASGGKPMSRQGTSNNLGLTRTMTHTTIQRSGRIALERNPSEDSSNGASSALPDGWQPYEDGDGHKYFFNQLTREMSWTRPVHGSFGDADGDSLRSLASSTKRGGKPTSTSAICIDHQAGLAAEHHGGAAGGNGGAGADLPTGWSEQRDEESGCSYYWNAATGESSWVAPPQPGSACCPSHV